MMPNMRARSPIRKEWSEDMNRTLNVSLAARQDRDPVPPPRLPSILRPTIREKPEGDGKSESGEHPGQEHDMNAVPVEPGWPSLRPSR
ncbi:MAG: hypothetical protein MZV70_35730 [Desulfobacterales bacterium]|nr:hypothetical protein [Desulfobacterales bacterium]